MFLGFLIGRMKEMLPPIGGATGLRCIYLISQGALPNLSVSIHLTWWSPQEEPPSLFSYRGIFTCSLFIANNSATENPFGTCEWGHCCSRCMDFCKPHSHVHNHHRNATNLSRKASASGITSHLGVTESAPYLCRCCDHY